MNIGWPDLLIMIIAVVGAVRGFRNGFVRELSGVIAVALALIAPWFYNGSMDEWIAAITHLGAGSAHVIGMFLTAGLTYGIVLMLAWALDRIAHLPVIGTLNAVFGAGIGVIKAAILCWVLLYVALFFPLSSDLRADLHRSPLVGNLTAPNQRVDDTLLNLFPWFAKPFVSTYFKRHHV